MSDSQPPAPPNETGTENAPYRVLARKYRPETFNGLIGQQAMVRTLTNAIQSGRLAHAFILTGIRGIGKTTTARIIARALNCIGADGTGGPTAEPCGQCEHCRAIAEDRHVDVLEMDAASRTGVDDIRELIEGVRYRPTSARFKVYIIDEVHMLSKNAFNALLKTLEEPPEHVKFIFATTEIRKIPVTVLSRCQRFDLRRVDEAMLADHFKSVAGQEQADISDPALALIARAADGSVRDGLSLLDQAITHVTGRVDEDQVRDMLGLADRTVSFDILEAVLGGDIAAALALLAGQYAAGADPVQVLDDMLDLVHWLTRIKVSPAATDDPATPEAEAVRGKDMAGRLSMAVLARAWQMLLKGLGEVRQAPSPGQACEMVLVRLAYAADLPTPAETVKKITEGGDATATQSPAQQHPSATPQASAPATGASPPQAVMADPPPSGQPVAMLGGGGGVPEPIMDSTPEPGPEQITQPEPAPPLGTADPQSFEDVVALADTADERILRAHLYNNVHLVRFNPPRIEFRPGDHAPSTLAHDMIRFLGEHTGRRWAVTVSSEPGQQTLRQEADERQAEERHQAAEDPLVRSVLDAFPGAKIEKVIDGGD